MGGAHAIHPNLATQSATKSASKVKSNDKKALTKSITFKSQGDEAGTAGGVVSNKIKGKPLVRYSFKVKPEGKNVPRSLDLVLHSNKNTPPFPVLQGPGALPMVNHDPDDVTLTVTDEQGNTTPLKESAVIELADGTVCIVCMQNQKLTRMLRLKGDVTFPRQPAGRAVPLQRK